VIERTARSAEAVANKRLARENAETRFSGFFLLPQRIQPQIIKQGKAI
jgi:hypothetical protein